MHPHRWVFGFCAVAFLMWSYDGFLAAGREAHRLPDRLGAALWALPLLLSARSWISEPSVDAYLAPPDAERPPPEVASRWNWGALLFCPLWSLGNRVYLGLLSLVPVVGLVVPFIVAYKGGRLSWERNPWRDADQFVAVQRAWLLWALAILATYFLAVLLYALSEPAG